MGDVIFWCLMMGLFTFGNWFVDNKRDEAIATAQVITVDKQTYRCVPVKVTTSVEELK